MTASGSSWGRDCLLMPRRCKAGKRKRKNLPFPDRVEERANENETMECHTEFTTVILIHTNTSSDNSLW